VVIGFILFILLGLTLGYAIPGWTAWLALLVPVVFAALSALSTGIDADLLVSLVVALALTAAAILAGRALDARTSRREESA
jgi:hypothetical protein